MRLKAGRRMMPLQIGRPQAPIWISLFLLFGLVTIVYGNCECGYTVDSTLYTEILETDFLHLPNITWDTDWQPQNYTVTPAASRGPYGKNASLTNIISNPLATNDSWSGDGVLGGDGGLQLWVRGGIPTDGLVPMAELDTIRRDMLFGSFRVAMKLTSIPGTCGAFFWYYNDTQEIDMEFLSDQFNAQSGYPVNLVLQSPASLEAGDNAANTSTFDPHPLPFNPDGEFHEYRFDWSPHAVSFYADGQLLKTMTTADAVPSYPGHIALSHWSNGNTGWSGGPPTTDAVLTVNYFKAYFNSSDRSRQQDWRNRCPSINAVKATCAVPDLTTAPPTTTGTFFFSQQANDTNNQTIYGKNSSRAPQTITATFHNLILSVALTCLLGISIDLLL